MSQSFFDIIIEATPLPTALAIGIGAAVGILVMLLSRHDDKSDEFDSERNDLEERKAHAVAQLRELEAQRERIDPDAYEQQRAEHERIAADALRARDKLLERRRKTDLPPAFLADQPVARGVIWGGGIVVALGITWLIVSPDEIQPARAVATQRSAAPPATSPELEEVLTRLRQNPADVDALVRGGSILAGQQRFGEARPYIDRALQLDPEHPGALVQYAALLASDGKLKEALARLDALVEKHPDVAEAWSLRAMIAMQAGDVDKGRASLDEYMKRAPEGPARDRIRAMLEDAPKAAPTVSAANGAELWGAKCALCHGADGRAQTRMGQSLGIPDLTANKWQARTSDVRIGEVIRGGIKDEARKTRMQAFPKLTAEEINALIGHIRGLGP